MKLEDTLKLWSKFEAQTSLEQIKYLYESVISTPNGDIVEVGSATGGSTIVLIGAAEEVGKNVYSVDPYPEEFENKASYYVPGIMNEYKSKFQNNILNGKWKNIIQYNQNLSDCINKIPENLSLVFIDGCHEYSFVLNEFKLLLPRLVNGGIMCIHDAIWTVGQLSSSSSEGVNKITEEFRKTFPYIVEVGAMLAGRK